jgi:NADPH2:quinone reductase
MLPETMICIEISRPGGPEVLIPATRPVPRPRPGEVVIKVAAAGLNRPDILQRKGLYPPPPDASDLPGLEVAGRIAAIGDGLSWPALDEPVCALVPGGGYAQYVAVDARHCLPIPGPLDMVAAAALPETVFTVWHNVVERGRLGAGDRFLVHGGSGGIGTIAIQLAKALGATVFTTASAAKLETCRALGADLAIDYRSRDFVEAVMAETGERGVNVILDMVGGETVSRNLKALAADGRLVFIAFMAGSTASVDFLPIMVKRLTVTGSTLRPQSAESKAAIARAVRTTVWPLVAEGKVRPVIHRTFPLERAADAHAAMEAGQHVGKFVLTCD